MAVAVASLAAVGTSLWLDLVTTDAQREAAATEAATSTALPGLLLAAASVVVLLARPGDVVGRLLGGVAVAWSLDGALYGWVAYSLAHDLPGTDLAYWFVARVGAFLLSGLVALLLLYPTGRLLGGPWRRAAVAVLLASLALPVGLLLAPDSVVFAAGEPVGSTEIVPLPVSDATAEVLLRACQLLTFASILAAVALVWVRHRHADAYERTQLRWLLWAGIMCVLMVLAALTLSVGGIVTTVFLDLAVAALAVSVTIGLLRPGLGDVDALVAWTLTTAVVAAIVVAVDLAVLAAGTALLGDRLDQRDVTLVVLVLAVVVYGPLRAWLGGLVHRVLLGRRSDRYGAVSALAARLETIGTVDEQLPALASAVADTFKVRHVRVDVLTPDGGLLSASHGTPPAEVQEIDIAYQHERVGRLVLPAQGYRSMLSRRDQGLLVDLVRQAAVAIRAGLLAAELQSSRERLVLGREDDRRRIRRDLHDGLGPVLGGVALRLQAAGNAIDTDPGRARELVGLARSEVSDALDDVRRLVHDLRPPALDDLGLEAAVRQQAERVRSEVDLDVSAADVTGLPAAVEVAAYRIVSEALANVVKHADARHVDVRLTGDGCALTVTVADDGRGIGPDVTAGVGLLSLRERAEELGGRCEVVCPESGGTTVRAVLPYGVATSPIPPAVPFGSQAHTRVPPPAGHETSHRPPSSSARSRSDSSPTPAVTSSAMPRPSSRTSTSSAVPVSRSRTVADDAPACFTTFVSASETMRYAATSTAAGRSSAPTTSTVTATSEETHSACCSRAARSPRSSRAGGRRSWTRRRTSSRASRTSVRASRIIRRADSGSDPTALPAASSRIATPPSVGPSPSCRSRRIRRRSSSRPRTRRSRLSWSSSASRLLRIAIAACRTRSPSSAWSRRDSIDRRPRRGSTRRPIRSSR